MYIFNFLVNKQVEKKLMALYVNLTVFDPVDREILFEIIRESGQRK